MDYIIKNSNGIYIRLGKDGKPETCPESKRGLFDYHKAHNICESLPKTLKRLQFSVEAIPDIKSKKEPITYIDDGNYVPNENITRWVEKFGQCGDVLKEASERELELNRMVSTLDKQLSDILHKVEIGKSLDLFGGWKIYKQICENRKKRRGVKDELIIIHNILWNVKGISHIKRDVVQKAIDGLVSRKYSFRIIDEEEIVNDV